MTNFNRRNFLLKTAGVGSIAFFVPQLFEGIISSFIRRELQGQSGSDNMKSIHLFAIGGLNFVPTFLPLTPYGTKNFDDRYIYTHFVEKNYRLVDLAYGTSFIHGIQLPYVWRHPVRTSSGDYYPSNLAKNLAVIRGINSGNSGHAGAFDLFWQPRGSKVSVTGLAPILGNSILSSAGIGPWTRRMKFASAPGKRRVTIGGKTTLPSLLNTYKMAITGQYRDKFTNSEQSISNLLDKMILESIKVSPTYEILGDQKKQVMDLLIQGVDQYSVGFDDAVARYKSLIYQTATQVTPGVNTLPVGNFNSERSSNDYLGYTLGRTTKFEGDDLRSWIPLTEGVTGDTLAKYMAFVETGIKNGLFDSISADLGGSWGGYGHDSHFMGVYPELYRTLEFGRVIMACLSELKTQFESANIWDQVVVEVSTEFCRSMRNHSGSDHGWAGQSVALLSGQIQNPFVIGNIWDKSENGRERYKNQGSWGSGAPTRVSSSSEFHLHGNIYLTTLASILKVPIDSFTNSLTKYTDQGLVKNDHVDDAKIVTKSWSSL